MAAAVKAATRHDLPQRRSQPGGLFSSFCPMSKLLLCSAAKVG